MKYTLLLLSLLCLIIQLPGQSDSLTFTAAERLCNQVNSSAEESLPIIDEKGKYLYFSRTYHPKNQGGVHGGQDIWRSSYLDDSWQEAQLLDGVNTKTNDVVVGIARDGRRLYLLNVLAGKRRSIPGITRVDYVEESDSWGQRIAVDIPELNVEGNFYSAYVSPDEDFILWSLPGNVPDSSNYLAISHSSDKGESWTKPESLGSTINTELDEISPFFDSRRKVLFWASNGRGGFGDYDIFYSHKLSEDWSSWSEPVNAGPEINSAKFEAYLFSDVDGSLYFCSNRSDSLSNIYVSSYRDISDTEEDEEADDEEDEENELAGLDPGDELEKDPYKEPVLIIDTKDGSSTDRRLSSMSREELLDAATHIRFVYFPYDKYNITAKYIEVLDDVGRLLDAYPDLNVLIEGHTDHVGSQAYNMVLSENRAQSTKEYLLIHGIDEGRILTKAYGKIQPYASNETEEGRALNRRVEIFFRER